MADKWREVFAPARFDEKQVEDDLAHLPDGAATALRSLRRDIDRGGGIAASRLKKCEAEGRDATNLPGLGSGPILPEWVRKRFRRKDTAASR